MDYLTKLMVEKKVLRTRLDIIVRSPVMKKPWKIVKQLHKISRENGFHLLLITLQKTIQMNFAPTLEHVRMVLIRL